MVQGTQICKIGIKIKHLISILKQLFDKHRFLTFIKGKSKFVLVRWICLVFYLKNLDWIFDEKRYAAHCLIFFSLVIPLFL